MENLSAFSARPRLAALLDVEDTRQAWKVMYPLREVLFLVVRHDRELRRLRRHRRLGRGAPH
jgi:hypothetical protein